MEPMQRVEQVSTRCLSIFDIFALWRPLRRTLTSFPGMIRYVQRQQSQSQELAKLSSQPAAILRFYRLHSSTSGLYSEVIRRRSINILHSVSLETPLLPMCMSINNCSQSRVANLVVSGLQPLPSVADATVVTDRCRSEFGIVPEIFHC